MAKPETPKKLHKNGRFFKDRGGVVAGQALDFPPGHRTVSRWVEIRQFTGSATACSHLTAAGTGVALKERRLGACRSL
jgi:hypothetical protein